MVGGQPALPPAPQRPAVMAGNEIVSAQSVYSRLSTSGITTTEIVPSTSNSHKHFKRRDLLVIIYGYLYYTVYFLIYHYFSSLFDELFYFRVGSCNQKQ